MFIYLQGRSNVVEHTVLGCVFISPVVPASVPKHYMPWIFTTFRRNKFYKTNSTDVQLLRAIRKNISLWRLV